MSATVILWHCGVSVTVNVLLWEAVGLGWADQVSECIRSVCVYLHTCHMHTLDATLGAV